MDEEINTELNKSDLRGILLSFKGINPEISYFLIRKNYEVFNIDTNLNSLLS